MLDGKDFFYPPAPMANLKTRTHDVRPVYSEKYANEKGYYTHELSVSRIQKTYTNLDLPEDATNRDTTRSYVRVALRPLDVHGNVRANIREYLDKKDGTKKLFTVPAGVELDCPEEYVGDLLTALTSLA